MSRHEIPARIPRCRVCGCTEDNACEGGCYWVNGGRGTKPLCSACAGTRADLRDAHKQIAALAGVRNGFAQAAQMALIARAAMRRAWLRDKGEYGDKDEGR